MVHDQALKDALYKACLQSARNMGVKLKTVSWFGHNVRREEASTNKAA
jgi:hypothetical protein